MEILKIAGILAALWALFKLIQFYFIIRPRIERDSASIHVKLDHLMSEIKEMKINIAKMESRVKDVHHYLDLEFPDAEDEIYQENPDLYIERFKAVAKKKGAMTTVPQFEGIPLQFRSPSLLKEF